MRPSGGRGCCAARPMTARAAVVLQPGRTRGTKDALGGVQQASCYRVPSRTASWVIRGSRVHNVARHRSQRMACSNRSMAKACSGDVCARQKQCHSTTAQLHSVALFYSVAKYACSLHWLHRAACARGRPAAAGFTCQHARAFSAVQLMGAGRCHVVERRPHFDLRQRAGGGCL